MRVVIVDDERLARERLTRLLAIHPDVQIVGEASDGLSALEAITTFKPDTVFLDIQMPALTGLEVAAALHQRKDQALQRIVGKHLNRLHVLPSETIEAFITSEELLFAITSNGRFLVERTLRDLEALLPSETFARVHKQTIVNLEKLTVLEPIAKGGATARLRCGEIVEISRRYAQELRQKLGW
jgi:DNA-binding LytR/AlgR family response regulator